jgi:short-subunit dehydrogenase
VDSLGLTNTAGIKSLRWHHCDVTSWTSLCEIFETIRHIDIAIANAGVSEDENFLADTFDADGKLEEPSYKILDVNYRAVLNFIKLSLRKFRKQGPGGSLVLTSSSMAYSPEQSFPVYGATKQAVSKICLRE